MGKRLDRAFQSVLVIAARRFPWLSSAKVHICPLAEKEHRAKWRQFAHTGHYKMTVCYARSAERELTNLELAGTSAHELGHIVGEELGFPRHASGVGTSSRTPPSVQAEANKISARLFGLRIRYNSRRIQEVSAPAARHTGPRWRM